VQAALKLCRDTLGSIPVVKSSAGQIENLIVKINEYSYVAWSKDKAYKFFDALIKELQSLISKLSAYTSPPAQAVCQKLKELNAMVINFTITVFEKIDEDAITPTCYWVSETGVKAIETTKSTSLSIYDGINSSVIQPTASCVKASIADPLYSQALSTKSSMYAGAVSTKQCAISTGAWVDTKLSLAEWLLFAASTSKKYDDAYFGGKFTSKTKELVSTAAAADASYTDGFFSSTLEEYKTVKARATTTTSAGAPVMKKVK